MMSVFTLLSSVDINLTASQSKAMGMWLPLRGRGVLQQERGIMSHITTSLGKTHLAVAALVQRDGPVVGLSKALHARDEPRYACTHRQRTRVCSVS